MTKPVPQRLERTSAPWWLWVLSAAYLLIGATEFFPPGHRLSESTHTYYSFSSLRSAIECLLFFWAAGREALGPRLRQALRMIGSAFGITGIMYLRQTLETAGAVDALPYLVTNAITFLSFFLAMVGIFRMPTVAAGRAKSRTVALDFSVALLGMAAVLVLVITMPQVAAAGTDAPSQSLTLTYGAAQILMLAAVNALVLRGVARPGRRAFWLLVSVFFLNIVMMAAAQFESSAGVATVSPYAELAADLASTFTIWAAVAFRRDPLAPGEAAPAPRWFATFNPLPLIAVAGVAILLLYVSYAPGTQNVRVVASIMVTQVALLLARLFLTAKENARLMLEEVEMEKELHIRKSEAVRRLAGGMAHWYNNLLTTVMGHAEIGLLADRLDPSVKRDFAMISAAAERAARITRQLLSYSGGQFFRPVPFDLIKMLASLRAQIEPMIPPGIALRIEPEAGEMTVNADLPRMESVIQELIANAVSATPAGGTITVRARRESIGTLIDSGPLPIVPGHYVIIEVADTGVGVPADRLTSIFDPFFTTQPVHASPGLGLAEVYGVVAAHGGGLSIQSAVGQGTRVAIYLPEEGPAGMARATA